ncbi:unnamed protein product [Prunus brigantina]
MNKEFTRKKVNIHREECHICGPHPPNRVMLLNKFWGQRGCAEHFKDGTLRCYACHRFKEREIKYVEVDGQQLCSYCYSITIMDPKDCKLRIFENVRRFYASIDLNVDEGIPILLVDRDQMIKFKNEKTETIHISCMPMYRINRCTEYEDRIKVEKKANKVNKLQLLAPLFCCGQRQMIRLLLQFGWPEYFYLPYSVLMGMALAHEMMHAWLSFQGLIGGLALERWVEEGICEVMSHKYGQWYYSRGFDLYKTKEQFNFTIKLYKYRAKLMKIRSDEIYGKGFNQVMQAVKEYGFRTTFGSYCCSKMSATCLYEFEVRR